MKYFRKTEQILSVTQRQVHEIRDITYRFELNINHIEVLNRKYTRIWLPKNELQAGLKTKLSIPQHRSNYAVKLFPGVRRIMGILRFSIIKCSSI